MKASKPNALEELRAKIGQAIKPPAVTPAPEPGAAAHHVSKAEGRPPQPARKRSHVTARTNSAAGDTPTPARSSGRGMHFYVDDSDRKILNSLAVWFASQDRRMSDSQVIKASIRLAAGQQNARLLVLADEIRAADRRRIPKRASKPSKK